MANQRYSQLAARLGVARRAYKRMTVLAGATVFLIEALGTIGIVFAADLLFDLATPGRVVLFAFAAIALVYFAFRHMGKPLLRPISDQQIALYLEQRNPQFEGALIAATEFGTHDEYTGRVAQIVDSILDQAVARAGKFDLSKAIDLARLKKYGMIAAVMIVVYSTAAVTMPGMISKRAKRAFMPWVPTPKEEQIDPAKPPAEPALVLALLNGDSSIVRGTALPLQASASRTPHEKLNFHFRSLAAGASSEWKILPMSESDQLNTFALTLPDVSEDLEFFVSAENAKSSPQRVTVFDPLLIKSYEVTTRFPAYLKFNDLVTTPETPDVAAVIGSNVSIRLTANGNVKAGAIKWDGQPETPATADGATATASFEVAENRTFRINLTDTHGQSVETPTPSAVSAITDQTPTVKLLAPGKLVQANLMSEIPFAAELADDLALEGATLVMTRGLEVNSPQIRFAMQLSEQAEPGAGLTAAKAGMTLMLEKISPPLTAGEVLSCYIEAVDRKGQKAPSDLVQIIIAPFESWAAWAPEMEKSAAGGGGGPAIKSLDPILQQAWGVYKERGKLSPNELNKEIAETAKSMTDDKGGLAMFWDEMKVLDPMKIEHAKKGQALAAKAHAALKTKDLDNGVALLRAAVAEMTLAGVIDVQVMSKPPESKAGGTAAKLETDLKKLIVLMDVKKEASGSSSAGKTTREENQETMQAANDTAAAEKLAAEQDAIATQMKKSAAGEKGADSKGADKKAADAQGALAKKAAEIAAKIKATAGDDDDKKAAANAIANAANSMKAAENAANKGDKNEAAKQANDAARLLADAKGKLGTGSQDKVNDAIEKAQQLAELLSRKQAELMAKNELSLKLAGPEKKAAAVAISEPQTMLAPDAAALAGAIEALVKSGESGALKPDTLTAVKNASVQLGRGRLEPNIKSAGVLLATGDAIAAGEPQKKVKDTADAIAKLLELAANSRATDLKSALKAAQKNAKNAKEAIAMLQGKAPGKDPNAKGEAPGKDPNAKGAAPGKDPNAKGEAPGKDPNAKGAAPGKDPNAKGEAPGKDPNAKGEAPGKDPNAKGEAPGKDPNAKGEAPGKDPNAKGEAPGKDPNAKGEAPGKDPNAKGEAPGKDPNAKGEAPGKDPNAKGEAPGKDPNAKGEAPGKDPNAKGEAPGKDPNAKGAAPGKDPNGKGDAPGKLTAAERKEKAAQTAAELKRLAGQLTATSMTGNSPEANEAAIALGKATKDPAKLAEQLENSPAAQEAFAKLTATLADHLEAEYASTLKSQELFASQREDCPPQYRPLVNKYFESIANGAK